MLSLSCRTAVEALVSVAAAIGLQKNKMIAMNVAGIARRSLDDRMSLRPELISIPNDISFFIFFRL